MNQTSKDKSQPIDYQTHISDQPEEAAWDNFLVETPTGHHVQAAVWGELKRGLNRSVVRVIVTQQAKIVAGAQLLIRHLPVMGTIAYIPRGPVFALNDPELRQTFMTTLHQLVRDYRIRYLVIQPPQVNSAFDSLLLQQKFRPSSIAVAPTATVQVDLQKPLDDILAGMTKTTRKYIRRGLRRGLTGREGTVDELPLFYRLMTMTCERQKFAPFPESYYTDMWRLLHPKGYLKLFMVDYEGEPVSAQINITFGDTIIAKNKGWSGEHKHLGPNRVMDWTIIEWGHRNGYQAYDFEGIDVDLAKGLLHGQLQPHQVEHGPTRYKLDFGGQVMLFPAAFDYLDNSVLRWGYNNIFPKIKQSTFLNQLIHRLRTT